MENATNGSPPKIKKLWGSVSNAVRAASVLPSLSRVIEELVLNSLDAGSNNIEVKVNPGTFSLEVNDDGKSNLKN